MNGAAAVVTLLEVRRELGRDVGSAGPMEALHRRADPSVERKSPCGRQPLVQRVAVQRVDERVAFRRGPRGEFGDASRRQEATPLGHGVAERLDIEHLRREGLRDDRGRELESGGARRLQQLAFVVAQLLELPVDHIANAVRYGDLHQRRVDRQDPSAFDARQRSTRKQVVDQEPGRP